MYTALIVLNYNNYEDTIECVRSIEKYNTASIKIIVVDNGSMREGVISKLDSFFSRQYSGQYIKVKDENFSGNVLPHLTFDISSVNDGYARGNNKGLLLANKDNSITHVMILNSDVLFVEDIIPIMLDYYNKLEKCAVLSPLLYRKNLKDIETACARKSSTEWDIILSYFFLRIKIPFLYSYYLVPRSNMLIAHPELLNEDIIEIELPSGSCFMIRKDIFNQIDGFDSHTFLYYEEQILYKKILSLGMKSYMTTKATAIHIGGTSIGKHNMIAVKANLNSAAYYLKNYCKLTWIQKIVLNIAYNLCLLKFKIYSFFHK